jgi:RNA polymerase sigma-70 factor (ECF subfamily)
MSENDGREKELQVATQHRPTAQRGSGEELEMIYREHHNLVFQAAYRITGNPMDAEDVLQTVFMRLARREGGPALSGNPAGYLHRAAVNAALDVVRSKKSARSSALEDVEPTLADSSQAGPERSSEDREIRDRVREALGRMNPKTAEVFSLRYFEGYGNHEIASMLGTSRSTVAVMLHRARNRLRNEISDLAGGVS